MTGSTLSRSAWAKPLTDRLGRAGAFLWSGWAGLAALSLLAALWQFGHEMWGAFILPSPRATVEAAYLMLANPDSWSPILVTVRRALEGFGLSAAIGATLGLAAGHAPAALRLARPLVTVIIGVPPIAWIVLALIWFGSSDGTVISTVVVGSLPIVFAGVAEGVMARDWGLDDMARAFGANWWQRVTGLRLRQVAAHLFPALALALGMAFKVAVMAELLANVGGIGGGLAAARSYLDVPQALAWVLIAVAALIVFEYAVIHPVRAEFERWRMAGQPWGVKR